MTKAIAILLAACLAAPPLAHAGGAAPDVTLAFGNTLLTIDPDGRSRKIWLQPDGAWTGLSRRGLDLAGTWTVRGDKVCLSQSKPRLFGRMCERLPNAVGASLQTQDPTGKTVQVKLVKGRVTK